jgi:hypothetical protein
MIVAQVVPSIPDVISAQADDHRHLAWRALPHGTRGAYWCSRARSSQRANVRRRHNEIDGKKVR